jgi:hypothetical protein
MVLLCLPPQNLAQMPGWWSRNCEGFVASRPGDHVHSRCHYRPSAYAANIRADSHQFCHRHDFSLLIIAKYLVLFQHRDRLCGLVVRVPGCRPRGPGFDSLRCQIFWVAMGLERGPLSPYEAKWGAIWKTISGSGLENWDLRPWGTRRADHATPLYPQKFALNFANKWRSLSRYSSLVD